MSMPIYCKDKTKQNQVTVLSDFRNLNEQLRCKLYPMPKMY